MKRIVPAAVLMLSVALAGAIVVEFDLSPSGTSAAVGLSPLNEVPAVQGSTGSGGELPPGITFDTDTRQLSLAFGCGSAFGFTDLTGPVDSVQIQGPASVTANGPALVGPDLRIIPSPDSTRGAIVVGLAVLSEAQAADLMAGLYYVNVSTFAFPSGELRGQLIPSAAANTAPTLTCFEPVTVECTSAAGAVVPLSVAVQDADDDPLTVVWTVDGTPLQTNSVSAPTAAEVTVSFSALFALGAHEVTVSVSDGIAPEASCTNLVTVQDTTGPQVGEVTAAPKVLWMPNHRMIPVKVYVRTTEDCGPVQCRIVSVTSNEAVNALGDGNTDPDWEMVDALTVNLRAERSGTGTGRIYSITVECTDEAGNASTGMTQVLVPRSNSN